MYVFKVVTRGALRAHNQRTIALFDTQTGTVPPMTLNIHGRYGLIGVYRPQLPPGAWELSPMRTHAELAPIELLVRPYSTGGGGLGAILRTFPRLGFRSDSPLIKKRNGLCTGLCPLGSDSPFIL